MHREGRFSFLLSRVWRAGRIGAILSLEDTMMPKIHRLATSLFILFAAISLSFGGARAGAEVMPAPCGEACKRTIQEILSDYFAEAVPPFNEDVATFDDALTADPLCPARPAAEPAVYAVLVEPDYRPPLAYEGSGNDVKLTRQVLLDRGISGGFITMLSGNTVTRQAVIEALRRTLSCMRERDQVLVLMSMQSTLGGWDTVAREWFEASVCTSETDAARKEVCDILGLDSGNGTEDFKDAAEAGLEQVKLVFSEAARSYNDQLLLYTAETTYPSETQEELYTGITAEELSNFVTQVRNRGADAFVALDSSYAAAANILGYQQSAAGAPGWSTTGSELVDDEGTPLTAEAPTMSASPALYGSGEFAAFYASREDQQAFVSSRDERGYFGRLTFAMSEVLRSGEAPKVRDFAQRIAVSLRADMPDSQAEDWQEPVFESSNPDLAFLAPRTAEAPKDMGRIEIISPAPKRGAVGIEEKTFELVARYDGVGQPFKAIVDGDLVDIDPNGQFRKSIADTGGKFAIAIRVLSANYETLAVTKLQLRERDDQTEIAPTGGRRLALVIANQKYEDKSYPELRTPIADAEALADILMRKFGFSTRIDQGGKGLDLFLRNATKAQIQQMLFELRRRLTAEDQLLVYYAGHGESDPDLGAYWVPVDGQPKMDYTWIAADEITRELKRMNAVSVLVISDSCYAGGLSRGSAGEAPPTGARDNYLAKAGRLKSRQLMASGGNEPVEDGGGGGHSVFAKALYGGLEAMTEQTFTASELFEQKVKPAVIAAASALSEGQTPGFHRISRAGDEPGSEFLFQAGQR